MPVHAAQEAASLLCGPDGRKLETRGPCGCGGGKPCAQRGNGRYREYLSQEDDRAWSGYGGNQANTRRKALLCGRTLDAGGAGEGALSGRYRGALTAWK